MTPQHNYPQGGSAAGRGIVIVIVAISLGVYLLAQAFDDGASEASEGAASGQSEEITVADGDDDDEGDPEDTGASGVTTTTTTTTTTTVAPPPPSTHPPNEVKVAAVNGKGAPGLASAAAAELNAAGFQTRAKNAVSFAMTESVIYYRPGYSEDAKAVATALNAPLDILDAAPANILTLITNPTDVSDFHVFVLLAADDAVPVVV